MKEIWKDIVIKRKNDVIDFTGFFQVSNLGNIRSLDRMVEYVNGKRYYYSGHPIATVERKRDGYVYVRLNKNQLYYVAKVHRLVADAFIPNPDNLPEVDHINTIRNDNRVDNLRWVSCSGNKNNPITKERRRKIAKEISYKVLKKRKENGGKKAEHTTLQYDLNGNLIREFKSLMQIGRELGYDPSSIAKCCKGKYKTSYGYIWKYKDK
jgi:hypothetical protein